MTPEAQRIAIAELCGMLKSPETGSTGLVVGLMLAQYCHQLK